MKTKLAVISASLLLGTQVFSATYSFNAAAGSTGHGIIDADGNSFRAGTTPGQVFTGTSANSNWTSAGVGSTGVGFFSTEDFSSFTSSASLLTAFTQFGGSGQFSAGNGGVRGVWVLDPPPVQIGGSQFANKNMFFIAGNGASLETSTQFLVLKGDTLFSPADDATPTAINVTFTPSNTEVLIGREIADIRTTNTDATATPGWQMAVLIPEPSTALLGLVGALGLLRRRR